MGSIWVHLEVHLGPSGGSQENPPPQGPLWSPPGALWGCRGDSGQGPKAPKVGFLLSERSIIKKRDLFRVNVFCSIAKHELVIIINLGAEFDGFYRAGATFTKTRIFKTIDIFIKSIKPQNGRTLIKYCFSLARARITKTLISRFSVFDKN